MTDLDKLEALAKAATPANHDDYDWNSGMLAWSQYRDATSPAEILALIAEVRALREDAGCYRWLRDQTKDNRMEMVNNTDSDMDRFIDEQIAKEAA
jgi:hypothetical protein